MADDLDHIHAAIGVLHPGAAPGDYLFARRTDRHGQPEGAAIMLRWDTDRLGPLDMAALAAECRRIASAPLVPASISDRQFAQALAKDGVITKEEARAWAARGDLPEAMLAVLQLIPEEGDQRFDAEMLLSGATEFLRHHPLVPILGAMLINPETGRPYYDAAGLDSVWTRAGAL